MSCSDRRSQLTVTASLIRRDMDLGTTSQTNSSLTGFVLFFWGCDSAVGLSLSLTSTTILMGIMGRSVLNGMVHIDDQIMVVFTIFCVESITVDDFRIEVPSMFIQKQKFRFHRHHDPGQGLSFLLRVLSNHFQRFQDNNLRDSWNRSVLLFTPANLSSARISKPSILLNRQTKLSHLRILAWRILGSLSYLQPFACRWKVLQIPINCHEIFIKCSCSISLGWWSPLFISQWIRIFNLYHSVQIKTKIALKRTNQIWSSWNFIIFKIIRQ